MRRGVFQHASVVSSERDGELCRNMGRKRLRAWRLTVNRPCVTYRSGRAREPVAGIDGVLQLAVFMRARECAFDPVSRGGRAQIHPILARMCLRPFRSFQRQSLP